jgi:hypothetical protein
MKGGLTVTTLDDKNYMRYFSEAEMTKVRSLGDTSKSPVLEKLNALHPINITDEYVSNHLGKLRELDYVTGISHHDQVYSKLEEEIQLEDTSLAGKTNISEEELLLHGFRNLGLNRSKR